MDAATRDRGRRLAWGVGIGLVIGIGLFIRAWYLFHKQTSSDEAVAGLIARQILSGHFYAFFWGQPFGGVEPYVAAVTTWLFGANSFSLALTPEALSLAASVLVWRVGRRFGGQESLGIVAGLLAFSGSLVVMHQASLEGGYRGVVLLCGLVVLLMTLRILDSDLYGKWWEWVGLGLAAGVGWWSLPEIGYFLLPAGLMLLGWLLVRGGGAAKARGVLLAVLGFLVGAGPWLWVNVSDGFLSLRTSGFSGGVSPANPGYLGRLSLFFQHGAPVELGLGHFGSGAWTLPTGAGRGLFGVVLVVGMILFLWCGWCLCVSEAGRTRGFAIGVAAFPFLVAAQPGTWYWQDGRYLVYLPVLLSLLMVGAAGVLVSRGAWRVETGRHVGAVLVAAVMCLVLIGFRTETGGIRAWGRGWETPDASAVSGARALENAGVKYGYADYWLAYKLDFVSGGRLVLATAGADANRWQGEYERVGKSARPVWIFADGAQLGLDEKRWAMAGEITTVGNISESELLSRFDKLGVSWHIEHIGGLDVVHTSVKVDPSQVGLASSWKG